VPANYDDDDAAVPATHCFPEPDSLALELCACAGSPAWVDPMLEELAALLIVSRSVGALAPGCSPTMAAASQESGRITDGPPFPDEDCPVDDALASVVACAWHTATGDNSASWMWSRALTQHWSE
jgi:hypothetical protein